MMKNLIIIACFVFTTLDAQTPLTNTFTYQGELKLNNVLANGSYDFEFSVFDVATAGSVLETVSVNGVTVTNGIFTTPITLTTDLFTGNKIWLDIGVRVGGTADPFDPLSPRQEVTSSPYAIHAQFVGSVGANAITGIQIQNGSITAIDVNTASVQTRVSGSCTAGNYIQSVNADGSVNCAVDSNTIAPPAWKLGGNAASVGDFIGTTNTEPFVVKVNGNRALEIQDKVDLFLNSAPNIILGADNNIISATFFGSTISGGRSNTISSNTDEYYGTISGGLGNKALSKYSTVGGGLNNTASGSYSSVVGGARNTAGGDYSVATGTGAKVRDSSVTGDADGDEGTFVWADASSVFSNFTSTGPNQFLIRAIGGMGIGTNAPNGYQLNVNGDSKIQGNLDVTGTGSFGILNVTGSSSLASLGVAGNSNLVDLNVSSSVNVNGTSYLRNDLDTSNDADLVLGGGATNATDDGVLTSDLTQASSDLLMKSNGNVIVTLDENDDEVGLFQVLDGLGNTLMQLSETGGAYFEVSGLGLSPPGFHVEQKGASGVGMLIRQTSTDANLVLVNKGTGDIIKAFTGSGGGNLMFRVAGNGNVTADGSFTGGGADFAEYLPTDETDLQVAEVVGLNNGKLGRDTRHAQRVMVISTNPAFVGNNDNQGNADKALVAFMGQVHVKVKGIVKAGDWLMASGHNDGYAQVVQLETIKLLDYYLIIGQALNSSSENKVLTLVGLPAHALMAKQQSQLDNQQKQIAKLESRQLHMLAQLQKTHELEQQLTEIRLLLEQNKHTGLLVQNRESQHE